MVLFIEISGMDRDSVSVDIGLLVALTKHLSDFAELVLHQFFGVALLDDFQVVHQDDPLDVVGHLERVGDLDYGAARVVLSQQLRDAPPAHEGRSVHHDDDRGLVQHYSDHGYLL